MRPFSALSDAILSPNLCQAIRAINANSPFFNYVKKPSAGALGGKRRRSVPDARPVHAATRRLRVSPWPFAQKPITVELIISGWCRAQGRPLPDRLGSKCARPPGKGLQRCDDLPCSPHGRGEFDARTPPARWGPVAWVRRVRVAPRDRRLIPRSSRLEPGATLSAVHRRGGPSVG